MPERGARIARREERACWAQVSDEQRREPGCPARQAVVIQRGQATRWHHELGEARKASYRTASLAQFCTQNRLTIPVPEFERVGIAVSAAHDSSLAVRE